ncbi:MAG TPA: tRNA lysidine(34) synthetase TilS, partial [Flavobacteriaceae bacterium]|nr:tRNA lysidine(34) synthetase TilS [Flavobacteriaceae bacterium]
LRKVDSDLDEQSVNKLAIALNVPFYVTHFDTKQHAKQHKLSIQEAARNLRYKWFEKIRKENELDYILTAHNLNDSLETFLINLSRGTGLKGLTGIPTIHNKIIRPLSSFTRNEIEIFASHNNIKWREDKSNEETKYTRNKIRHKIIPILQELNPNLLDSFKQTLKNLQGSEDIIQDTINSISAQMQLIASQRIFNISTIKNSIKTNPQAYIHEMFSPYGFTNITDIINLLSAQSGKQVFSKTHRLIKDRDLLLMVKNRVPKLQERKEIFENDLKFKIQFQNLEIKFKIETANNKQQTTNNLTIQTDKFKIKFPLIIRKWQKGDYFYPIGMKGKKKLSKYFKDEKMSLLEKENIWLLLSDNKIVWVIGKRQDERFKVTQNTKEILTLSIKESLLFQN